MPVCMDALLEAAKTKPLFGVCVGEQMLFDWSDEGNTPCLGLLPGKVIRFQLEGQLQEDGSRFKVPQMGWNQVRQVSSHPLWQGIPDNSLFLLRAQLLCGARESCAYGGRNGVRFANLLRNRKR